MHSNANSACRRRPPRRTFQNLIGHAQSAVTAGESKAEMMNGVPELLAYQGQTFASLLDRPWNGIVRLANGTPDRRHRLSLLSELRPVAIDRLRFFVESEDSRRNLSCQIFPLFILVVSCKIPKQL